MNYFGTDGIRRNADFFSYEFLERFAGAIVSVFGQGEYVLARDTRVSGEIIEQNLAKAFNKVGANVVLLGISPTPILAFYARVHKANAGIMITASHNPPQDNGLKVFDKDGYKVSSALEDKIEQSLTRTMPNFGNLGATVYEPTANEEYIKYLIKNLAPNLAGLTLALDTANGATAVVAQDLFSRLGCKTFIINDEISGHNINKDCGAIYPKALEQFMESVGIKLGFSFDGDGDRVVCRADGVTLNGDHILEILAMQMLDDQTLAHNGVVGTVMSNLGLEQALAKQKVILHRVAVGDKNVLELIRAEGYTLGGEQSGHIVNTLYQNTGDGLLIALLLSQLYVEGKLMVKHLFAPCPQLLTSVELPKKDMALNIEEIVNVQELSKIGANAIIRKSGTEPIVRVMVQGEDEKIVAQLSYELTSRTRDFIWRNT